jgi:hypothetical protein
MTKILRLSLTGFAALFIAILFVNVNTVHAVDSNKGVTDQTMSALAGTYYIPQGSNENGFPSLKAALDAINANGVSAAVTLLIDADLNETAGALNLANVSLSAANTVTIKPAPDKTPTITLVGGNTTAIESPNAGIAIFNTSFVIIDGSNEVGGDSRDLTLTYDNADATGEYGVINIVGNAKNVVVKNTIIQYNAGPNSIIGIRVRRDNAADSVPEGLLFENNSIGSLESPMKDGIALFGTGTPLLRVIATVKNSTIYAAHRGITTFFVAENEYSGNSINVVGTFSNPGFYAGIYLAGGADGTHILANRITLWGTSFTTADRYAGGVVSNLNAGTTNIINNMFSVPSSFQVTGEAALNLYAFVMNREGAGDTYVMQHNSSFMANITAITGRSAFIGFEANGSLWNGINHSSTFEVQNNIARNENALATSYIMQWPSTSGALNANYNNYSISLVSNANVGTYQGTVAKTVTNWRTASGKDANSVSRNVNFVSETDLTLTGSSLGDQNLSGTPLANVTVDINGTARSATNPYMGAYEGEASLVSIDDLTTGSPSEFRLSQNYPNPFNPTTQISFELPQHSDVRLDVYSTTGQLITTLVNETRSAGLHTVRFDGTGLASGVYIYRIVAGDFVQTQRMTLIK